MDDDADQIRRKAEEVRRQTAKIEARTEIVDALQREIARYNAARTEAPAPLLARCSRMLLEFDLDAAAEQRQALHAQAAAGQENARAALEFLADDPFWSEG